LILVPNKSQQTPLSLVTYFGSIKITGCMVPLNKDDDKPQTKTHIIVVYSYMCSEMRMTFYLFICC